MGVDVTEFLDYLTVEGGLSENTILAYGRDLLGFVKYCEEKDITTLGQIRPETIYGYLRHLAGKRGIGDVVGEALGWIKERIEHFLEVSGSALRRLIESVRGVLGRVWKKAESSDESEGEVVEPAMSKIRTKLRGILRASAAAAGRITAEVKPAVAKVWRLGRGDAKKKCETSINRSLVAIKMLVKFGLLTDRVTDDFTSIIDSPKKWQKLPFVCSKEKVVDLLEAPTEGDSYYLRDRAVLEMLYATGTRASEVAGLKTGDLNLSIGYLRCMGKGNKERIIPLGRTAIRVTRQYLEDAERGRGHLVKAMSGNYLFLSRTGRKLDRIDIWRLVKKYAQRAGAPSSLTVHTIRHCFATHMLSGGADLRSLQEMLGHADISTTQIYTHVDQRRLKEIHKQFHPRP